ncbi:hypothetical protein BKA69DRAFT_943872 [Paraphysoderma sedebokerense]|nr:hypothetical protein BKA69DRAFT_943872 [Paraphysoderma sedebokerense]
MNATNRLSVSRLFFSKASKASEKSRWHILTQLPNELLELIFRYLDKNSLYSWMLVSKRYHAIAYSIWQSRIVLRNRKAETATVKIMAKLIQSDMQYFQRIITEMKVEYTTAIYDFLYEYEFPNLQLLDIQSWVPINSSGMTRSVLESIAILLSRKIMPLKKLKYLRLPYLDFQLFVQCYLVGANFPSCNAINVRLDSIILDAHGTSDTSGLLFFLKKFPNMKEFYMGAEKSLHNTNHQIMTFDLWNMLLLNGGSLQKLELANFDFNSDDSSPSHVLRNLELRNLGLFYIDNLSNEALHILLKSIPGLSRLSFHGFHKVSYPALAEIATHLESLSIYEPPKNFADVVLSLANNVNLKEIEVSAKISYLDYPIGHLDYLVTRLSGHPTLQKFKTWTTDVSSSSIFLRFLNHTKSLKSIMLPRDSVVSDEFLAAVSKTSYQGRIVVEHFAHEYRGLHLNLPEEVFLERLNRCLFTKWKKGPEILIHCDDNLSISTLSAFVNTHDALRNRVKIFDVRI